jgi:hypothetical protein
MPAYTRALFSRKFCAANFVASWSMKTMKRSASSTSCRAPRHTLAISKAPAQYSRCIAKDCAHVASGAHKVAGGAMTAFKADGIAVQQISEATRRQVVSDLHLHVM